MWLLLKSVYAPDMAGLPWDSNELLEMFARSATWKTKSLRPVSWRRVLQKEDWIQRLFIPTSKLSIHCPGAVPTSSQEATPVSHSLSQENEKELKTRGICGHTSQGLFPLSGRKSVSSRTSGGTFDWDCPMCLGNSDLLATELGREYSQRRTPARRTEEKEFLSWPTATAMDPEMGPAALSAKAVRLKKRNDGKNGTKYSGNGCGPTLGTAVQIWPISRLEDQVHAQDWSTPRASPNENRKTKPAPSHGKSHGRCLAGDVQLWRIPSETDGVGGAMDMEKLKTKTEIDGSCSGPESRWPARPGEKPHEWEEPRTIDGKLNPGWVEQLMGLRAGWTRIVDDPRKHREQRLRACGNGVVPQQAEFAIRTLMEAMEK